VPDLEVLEHCVCAPRCASHFFPSSNSTCILDQKLSVIELSSQSPMLPIDAGGPDSFARRVKAHEPNGAPSSERIAPRFSRWPSRLSMATARALVTRAAVGEASVDQPATRRE
jgi:hypothetical protein